MPTYGSPGRHFHESGCSGGTVRAVSGYRAYFYESGGDNLAATFSPELVDGLIFVIDVGEGEKIPRKGGPGITQSELLVINKIDIAPYVHSDLHVMEEDTKRMRGEKPYVFTNLYDGTGLDRIIAWIKKDMLFEDLK